MDLFKAIQEIRPSLVAQTVRNLPTMWETQLRSLGWEWISWRREWQPSSVLLPGEFHGQRSLGVGLQSMGCKESEATERLTLTLFWKSVMKIHLRSPVFQRLHRIYHFTPNLHSPLTVTE